jgi:hypothetical protein
METKNNWRILIVWLPLLPLILRGIIKILMSHLEFDVINAAELWFVLAIICVLISQDLRLGIVPLDNEDKKKERTDRASWFIVLSIIFIFCCPVSEIFHILYYDRRGYDYAYIIVTLICYASAFITINFTLKTQDEFGLTANFF